MNSSSRVVMTSFSSMGVSPSAWMSSSSGTEILPSLRTGTVSDSSGFFQTLIRSESLTPMT